VQKTINVIQITATDKLTTSFPLPDVELHAQTRTSDYKSKYKHSQTRERDTYYEKYVYSFVCNSSSFCLLQGDSKVPVHL
jgi:hypothetical protein